MARWVLVLSALLWVTEPKIPGLVEVPAARVGGNRMSVLYTGDGGWRTADRGVASILADNGIPVVGLNTLRYFWTRRTPEEAAIDFQRVLNRYLPLWKKDKVVVIGYSFGADVLPFILNRIPKPLLARIEMLVLLAPTRSTDFEFHLRQWFSDYNPKTARAVLPELKELGGLRILAFCGEEDGGALCKDLPGGIKKVLIPRAGHRFDQCYSIIAQDILKEVGSPVKR